jgi:hypothetical protein
MNASSQLQFLYRFPVFQVMRMVLLVFALTAFCGYMTGTNEKALLINSLIYLSPKQATYLYGAMTLLMLFADFVAVKIAIRSFRPPFVIELNPDTVVVPQASLSGKALTIPYGKIRQASLEERRGHLGFSIKSPLGDSSIAQVAFKKPQDFELFVQEVLERLQQLPSAPEQPA